MSVVLVVVPETDRKGTGWLVSDRHIVTNEHVVRGGNAGSMVVQFSDGSVTRGTTLEADALTDIAVVTLPQPVKHVPLRIDRSALEIGTKVCAWGHPLGYNGPPPILSVGYLAGFHEHQPRGLVTAQRRLVLNAALNPGNSGGPVLAWGEQSVRGVAVTKHLPIPPFVQSAMEALSRHQSGFVYTGTDDQGKTVKLVESQVVAKILEYFRDMTQVVIGEAISAEDVIAFLDMHKVPWTAA